MQKVLKTLVYSFLIMSISALFTNSAFAQDDTACKIKEGTFLRVINLAEISSLMADKEDETVFINTSDMYIYETNRIPKNTKIYGEIEEVLEPIKGKNGAIKISVNKMITPDKKVYKFKGHIQGPNNGYFGGEKTAVTYYHKVPHYIRGLKPMLQVAPTDILDMGQHTIIKAGTELILVIEEEIVLK